MQRVRPILTIILLFGALAPLALRAEPDPACLAWRRPAATLLVPYFEVDLADPGGRTTLFSVNNASPEPVLARMVVWTDWGIPVLAFDLHLTADDVQPVNLRQVLADGSLPATGSDLDPASFPSCTRPLSNPALEGEELQLLQDRLTGRPVPPEEDLCFSSPQTDTRLAVGFLTADVLNDCSQEIVFPRDEGYFENGGVGLASNRNALWGNFYLLDPASEFAQGFEAVHVAADGERFAPGLGVRTFYGRGSNRSPLASKYRMRFLNGGGFNGSTELLLWTWGLGGLSSDPAPCVRTEPPSHLAFTWLRFHTYDESGELTGSHDITDRERSVWRIRVGEELLPIAPGFGQFDLSFLYFVDTLIGVEVGPTLGWAAPVLSAWNRFSVGFQALPLVEDCYQ